MLHWEKIKVIFCYVNYCDDGKPLLIKLIKSHGSSVFQMYFIFG